MLAHEKLDMRTKGKITTWKDENGFGFITPITGGKPIFVHIKAFGNINLRPGINQLVTYALAADKQGRPCAVKAKLDSDKLHQKANRKGSLLPITVTILFLVIVGISVLTAKIHPLVFALYIVASLLAFIMYAVDKSAAKRGAWRTQESTLHLLSVVGGWPGALVAQQKFRHKTKKLSFQMIFWVTVLLNCGAFVWLFTPTGTASFQSLIDSVL